MYRVALVRGQSDAGNAENTINRVYNNLFAHSRGLG